MPNTTGSGSEHSASTTASLPVNATVFRRYLTLCAIKILKRFRHRSGPVLFLSDKICVKYGRLISLSEASSMQFVAKHSSIPVPRVYCAFTHANRTYIVVERLHGEIVGQGWLKRPEESRRRILGQLKAMVEELRRISPPPNVGVANVDGGQLCDPRLPGPSDFYGPFKSVQDFHRHLREGHEARSNLLPEVNELISRQDKLNAAPVVFTHGDLSSLNVLASGDDLVGLIDWATAGWFPPYWEYTTAWNVNPQNEFWRDEVDKFLQPMKMELEMEQLRLKYFGMF